jgi:hypothetical protein
MFIVNTTQNRSSRVSFTARIRRLPLASVDAELAAARLSLERNNRDEPVAFVAEVTAKRGTPDALVLVSIAARPALKSNDPIPSVHHRGFQGAVEGGGMLHRQSRVHAEHEVAAGPRRLVFG